MSWVVGIMYLVMPVAGVLLCLVGGFLIYRGSSVGWTQLGAGAALILLDAVIGVFWARSGMLKSDEPNLNRRMDQLAHRTGEVVEAIEGGRGKIRVGDTFWIACGPDAPVGTTVRIAAVDAAALVVEPALPEMDGAASIIRRHERPAEER